jgi:hypothetical protein
MPQPLNPTVFDDVRAAAMMGVLVLFSPLLRPWYRRWGLSAAEAQCSLPGDEIAPDANLTSTRAIVIHAPVRRVWPWLVQIGQEKGALYSYERLENMAKCQMRNADRIVPEWQHSAVGDNVRLGPKGYPLFRVVEVEPGKRLVMQACDPVHEQPGPASWCFVLEALDANTTRLWARNRNRYEPTFGNTLMWRVFVDPISFVMERGMLIGIQRRAEQMQDK